MNNLGSETTVLRPLIVLSIAQLIGWGTVSFSAVVSREMAADLHIDLSAVFAGTTVFYLTMGACAPFLSRLFAKVGARRVMMAGTIMSAFGLALLSLSHGPLGYFLGWLVLGLGGSATLTTPAHILLNEIAGRSAARAITTLMLFAGLSSTMFWPFTSLLAQDMGWRGTCGAYAVVLILVCLPLYTFGLPQRRKTQDQPDRTISSYAADYSDPTFYLIVAAIAFNAFITFGFSAILIELLKAEGLSPAEALAFGSALGIVQIAARGLNIIGQRRWDGVTMGVVSSAMLCLSLAVLIVAGGSIAAVSAFLLLYGISSGALAVARSTIPLVFYDRGEFAKALSRIALPLNWISAVSPPVLISLMSHLGSGAVLLLCMVFSGCAMLVLLLLKSRRPRGEALSGTNPARADASVPIVAPSRPTS